MKKMVAILMVLCLCTGLCGCSGKTEDAGNGMADITEKEQKAIDLTVENFKDYFTIDKSVDNSPYPQDYPIFIIKLLVNLDYLFRSSYMSV